MTEERYEFTAGTKKKIFILGAVGIALFVIGIFVAMNSGHDASHGGEAGHALNAVNETSLLASTDTAASVTEAASTEGHHEGSPLKKRIFSNLWINNVYFTGLAIIGLFFIAIQYAAQAGWSAGMKRIPLAMAGYLPIAGVLMIATWLLVHHDVFHWTHSSLYLALENGGDKIIQGKAAFWYWPMEMGTFSSILHC